MKANASRRASLAVEALEDRCVPTTATLYSNGVLSIVGTNYADRINVQQNGTQISVSNGSSIIPINGYYAWVSSAVVTRVVVNAGAGDDVVSLDGNGSNPLRGPGAIYGGAGNDLLVGGAGNDYIDGGGGRDTMLGIAGYDTYFEPYSASAPVISGTRPEDIHQGQNSGSCALLAALASGAARGMSLAGRITYQGGTSYTVLLYNPTTLAPVRVPVTFDGTWHSAPWLRTLASELANDPTPAASGEFWTILYQRAYLSMMNSLFPNSVQYANPNNVVAALTGRRATGLVSPGLFGGSDLLAMTQALASGRVVVAGTRPNATAYDPMLVPTHAYSVMNVFTSGGVTYVTLRNPWASDGLQAPRDGADDGYVTISWTTFQAAFLSINFA